MYQLIFKRAWLYYVLTLLIIYMGVNTGILDCLRLDYLKQYKHSSKPQNRVLLFDYITHLQPDDDIAWSLLAQNYALYGDYADAVDAYRKAISINPNKSVYQQALSRIKE
jgi:tetratricopeptide (TPR) repeat protein